MDHDTAYVEAVGSVNTCEVLKYLGLICLKISLAQRCVTKPITMNLAVPLAAVLEHRA